MILGGIARAGCAAAVLLSVAASAEAATVSYTFVPAESGLGLTGQIGEDFITGNGRLYTPGASGQFTADRTGNTVNFTGGTITAANKGNFSPGPGAASDPFNDRPAPANFGFSGPGVQGAIRDLKFHIVSDGPTTIGADGRIPTDSFEIVVDSGTYAFLRNDGQGDDTDISGTRVIDYKINETSNRPTFSANGDSEYLILPFQFTVITSTFTTNDTQLTFNGTLEATAPAVPEPAGMFALAGAAAMSLGRRRRR